MIAAIRESVETAYAMGAGADGNPNIVVLRTADAITMMSVNAIDEKTL